MKKWKKEIINNFLNTNNYIDKDWNDDPKSVLKGFLRVYKIYKKDRKVEQQEKLKTKKEETDYKDIVQQIILTSECKNLGYNGFIISFNITDVDCDTTKSFVISYKSPIIGHGTSEIEAWKNAYYNLKEGKK